MITLHTLFDAGQPAYDDTTFITSISGARVHTEIAATVREIGLFMRRNDDIAAEFTFMIDRTVVADTVITTGLTATVSYQVQH